MMMGTITRREMLAKTGAGAALLLPSHELPGATPERMAGFSLPALPYPYDALEPHIDAETMKIHHDRHHLAYVNNLNASLKDQPELLAKPIEDLLRAIDQVPEPVRQKVVDHGGGHANH